MLKQPLYAKREQLNRDYDKGIVSQLDMKTKGLGIFDLLCSSKSMGYHHFVGR
ncbi:hypothetical protein ADIAL_2233 [Alkalibacterium sp. AK22]|nr:hypothetical protein ADIAL_2233 [Alkalibacterium sp. AK22]